MGRYVNSDNSAFQVALNTEIYVDKTELLAYTNRVMDTKKRTDQYEFCWIKVGGHSNDIRGINYDKKTKAHACVIEEFSKKS